MNTDIPLIYTTKGNLPINSLQYRHQWLEDVNTITFVEEYLLDEEVVKRNVHCKYKCGMNAELEQAIFG